MMAKKERLSRTEFNRFFSLGKRSHTPLFQVIYAPQKNLHVSVVVSKKVLPSAVQRNKLRRRTYDIIRNYSKTNPLQGVFILIAKQPCVTQSFTVLKHDVLNIVGGVARMY